MKTAPLKDKRRYPRVKTEPGTVVGIRLQYQGGDFEFEETAIVLNESSSGACLVIPSTLDVMIGDTIWVKIGDVEPIQAQIRWITTIDPDVRRMGLFYLETEG